MAIIFKVEVLLKNDEAKLRVLRLFTVSQALSNAYCNNIACVNTLICVSEHIWCVLVVNCNTHVWCVNQAKHSLFSTKQNFGNVCVMVWWASCLATLMVTLV